MLVLWCLLGSKLTGLTFKPFTLDVDENVIDIFPPSNIDSKGAFFLATFISSVFTASKGIAGFLLHGPCKLVPTDGPFGGMGKLGFILLVFNIATTLCGKGILLAFLFIPVLEVSFIPLLFSKIYLNIFFL